ncbi:hypothetical protein ACFE04_031108 [Oxalis oulophora]
MATILNYMSVTSSTTTPRITSSSSSSQDPSTIPTTTTTTKIILPKKKPEKWSTGVAPGDYGGPPVTTKLRKYWGGEKEDPLTSDEFIWNTDFMPRMKRLIQDNHADVAPQIGSPVKEESSGFLSFNRVMSLDSVEVDLSKELATPLMPVLERPVESVTSPPIKWKFVPTRREQERWDRANKGATGGSDAMLREVNQPKGDPVVLAAESRELYFKLKNRLQVLTLGIGGIGLVSAYLSYTPEITISFGAGFLGSLMYIRMLGSSVDSMAPEAGQRLMKGAMGQPRLLVPVVLVMVFNRWNGILVPEYGIMSLQLIPMLVGFFTYKVATFAQAIEGAITVTEKKTEA